ncbi:MAG: phage portal protein, partial [Oscillospiraceae bacterium]|nr:phage portal protein [Oscillospiraceae bacterium]
EIKAGIRRIAELMSVMPLHLLENTANGNVRRNDELSRKLDITPCRNLSRPQWITKIVRDMLESGNSYGIPVYNGSYLDYIIPVTAGAALIPEGPDGYTVNINGVVYEPDEVLHFAYNAAPECPWDGKGLKVELQSMITALAQAKTTTQAIMENPMPSIVVRVDNTMEDLSTPEGRKEISDRFIKSVDAGTPWILSANNFDLQQIKPLSLNDLAIKDGIEISTKQAAAVLGVPPSVLGVGSFSKDEYNNFISTRLQPLAVLIEQELTRKLLYSPSLFFRFSTRQLFSYTLEERLRYETALVDRGILSGNEVREDFGLEPVDGLDERRILENFIPYSMSGNQAKLNGGGE